MCNVHWPQARVCGHGMHASCTCRLCLACEGTLWHRQYECVAHQALRRDEVSPWLAERARNVRAGGREVAERFARGVFPSPLAFFPRVEPEVQVRWINKPPSGLLTGMIFSDGSAFWPGLPGLSRAGWALVQVDRLGNVLHAAYGPVPFKLGPRQTAKDGEDFAVHMLTFLGIGPFELFLDCQSTLDILRKGPGAGVDASSSKGHLWGPFWGAFEASDLSAHKTLAHATAADVEAGKSTWWERKANQSADTYAKAGATMHGLTDVDAHLYRGFKALASESCKWAGRLEVSLSSASAERQDTVGLSPPGAQPTAGSSLPVPEGGVRLDAPEPAPEPPPDEEEEEVFVDPPSAVVDLAEVCKEDLADQLSSAFYVFGHGLVKCAIETPSREGSSICFCIRCGAYGSDNKPGPLMKDRCKGHPASPGIKSQMNRVRKGKHPHYRATTKSLVLGSPGPLSLQERTEIESLIVPPSIFLRTRGLRPFGSQALPRRHRCWRPSASMSRISPG